MAEQLIQAGSQNTGNPVLDSTVNIITALASKVGGNNEIKAIHQLVLEMAKKEPGGLKYPNQMNHAGPNEIQG